MTAGGRCGVWILFAAVLTGISLPRRAEAQQVLQRGPLGHPAQVLDEAGQWTAPLLIGSDAEIEVYIPDLSTTDWLQRNYRSFFERQQYQISVFTFYKSLRACRQNQIAWGFGDQAHLDACVDIGYRLRQVMVDAGQRTVTLQSAAMLTQDGLAVPDSGPVQQLTRTWAQLDPLTQKVLEKMTELAGEQERAYDRRINRGH